MLQQILFIGGPGGPAFDEVPTPLPAVLSVAHGEGAALDYALRYVVETRRRHADRRWPVYVHGALPPASVVLNLWYPRATMWQLLPSASAGGSAHR
ncbi:MAG: hypothetical protein QM766_27865 [Burkholderiaceae bacterium]